MTNALKMYVRRTMCSETLACAEGSKQSREYIYARLLTEHKPRVNPHRHSEHKDSVHAGKHLCDSAACYWSRLSLAGRVACTRAVDATATAHEPLGARCPAGATHDGGELDRSSTDPPVLLHRFWQALVHALPLLRLIHPGGARVRPQEADIGLRSPST
jgi:hypothetical protein